MARLQAALIVALAAVLSLQGTSGQLGGLLPPILPPILGPILGPIGGLLSPPSPPVKLYPRNTAYHELLYVWTGDDDHQQPDFIAVVDFNRSSPTYGKVINKVDLTGYGAYGNEPHHLTFSTDYNRVAAAGILSFLYPFNQGKPVQAQVFIFDTTDPVHPVQINTANPLLSGAADELLPLASTGGFLLSSLSTRAGTPIGRLTELDRDGNVLDEYPNLPPLGLNNPSSLNGFLNGNGAPIPGGTAGIIDALDILSLETLNIHGIAARVDLDILVTTDFIEPVSALNITQLAYPVYNGIRYQPTFRKWKLSTRQIVDTWVTEPESGNLVVHYLPGDSRGRFYGTGVHANKVYLLDPDLDGTHGGVFWTVALDLTAQGLPASDPHYFVLTTNHTGFLTLNAADKIVYFDWSNPEAIKIISIYSQPTGSNPHYIALYPGGLGGTQSKYDNRFVVVNYFLDFKNFGLIHRPGTKILQVFQWNKTHIFPDPKFAPIDFKTEFPENGITNPHGTTYFYPPNLYPGLY